MQETLFNKKKNVWMNIQDSIWSEKIQLQYEKNHKIKVKPATKIHPWSAAMEDPSMKHYHAHCMMHVSKMWWTAFKI